jgi:hypothetical protein
VRVAFFLLGWVFLTHFGYDWISEVTGVHRATVFYVLMGLWTAILCGFIQYLVWGRRNEWQIKVVIVATGIGILEGSQMLCLLLGAVPDGVNACDYHSGLKITATSAALYLFYIVWSLRKK